jgi:hypothetical protein
LTRPNVIVKGNFRSFVSKNDLHSAELILNLKEAIGTQFYLIPDELKRGVIEFEGVIGFAETPILKSSSDGKDSGIRVFVEERSVRYRRNRCLNRRT